MDQAEQKEPSQVRTLYTVRTAQGKSLAWLAREIKKVDPQAAGRSMLTDFENCKHDTSLRTLEACAAVLQVRVDDLVQKVPRPAFKPRGQAAGYAPAK